VAIIRITGAGHSVPIQLPPLRYLSGQNSQPYRSEELHLSLEFMVDVNFESVGCFAKVIQHVVASEISRNEGAKNS
jgi:hypothetical protein